MSKATTKARIQAEITTAIANDSITPTIVGSILDEILELDLRPYRVFIASVSQFGLNVPTYEVLENTTGVDFTCYRSQDFSQPEGSYYFQADGVFTPSKTFSFQDATRRRNDDESFDYTIYCRPIDINNFGFNTISSVTGQRADGCLINILIEIRVYN